MSSLPKKGYGRTCPDIDDLYEFAELKTSILIQSIVNDEESYKMLTIFLQDQVKRVFDDEILMNRTIDNFILESVVSSQNTIYDEYPVAQTPNFKTRDELFNDFFALFNFFKYIWYNMRDRIITEKNAVSCFLINIFQQNITILDDIRGQRTDAIRGPPNDQIGITELSNDYLKRRLRKPDAEIKPWIHPGKVKCGLDQTRRANEDVKKNKYNFLSEQCGISGSTRFILFLYLISILESKTSPTVDDVKKVILTACLILGGDGGHNIRECIAGLTISIITLKTILEHINEELEELNLSPDSITIENKDEILSIDILRNMYKKIKDKIKDLGGKINDKKMFLEILRLCVKSLNKWREFISIFYEYTKKISIYDVKVKTGVDESDIMMEFENSKRNITQYLIFDKEQTVLRSSQYTALKIWELFFILEGGRYKLPSGNFATGSNTLILDVVKVLPTAVLTKTVQVFDDHYEKCQIQDKIKYPVEKETIPFSFNSKKRSSRKKKSRSLRKNSRKKKSRRSSRKK